MARPVVPLRVNPADVMTVSFMAAAQMRTVAAIKDVRGRGPGVRDYHKEAGRSSKYTPHQGERERARRRAQLETSPDVVKDAAE